MFSRRLLTYLAIIDWSVRDLARRLGEHQTTVTRWVSNQATIPAEVAAWLEILT